MRLNSEDAARLARTAAVIWFLLADVAAAPLAVQAPSAEQTITLSIVGTNDLHGALQRLPVLAGYLANLRAARAADGGGVLLVDAGDMFQGTMESNLNEGAAVIAAYNAMAYDAAAVGNHEFDFGPEGTAATARRAGDDPRGALKARAREAQFPLLMANVLDQVTGKRADWPNMPAAILLEKTGIHIGVIGVTTAATPKMTMAANFRGLKVASLPATIQREAARLRALGAAVIVVAAHAGGQCNGFRNPDDLSVCTGDGEIFDVARALPPGLVDVIVAGHTHSALAHRINGIAVIESYAGGHAFGRVDLLITEQGIVKSSLLYPPRDVCPGDKSAPAASCIPGSYEGRQVVPDERVAAIASAAFETVRSLREQSLGVVVTAPVTRAWREESALGNLFADLMLAASPDADVAVTNGGGLRANLPAGPLIYAALYEAMPFDNRFARIRLKGRDLRRLIAHNLSAAGGIFSYAGIRAKARCERGRLSVYIQDAKGRPVADDQSLNLVTSDFLASGGDNGFSGLNLPASAADLSGDTIIRDAMADVLRQRGGVLSGNDPAIFNPAHRRLDYPGERPLRCGVRAG